MWKRRHLAGCALGAALDAPHGGPEAKEAMAARVTGLKPGDTERTIYAAMIETLLVKGGELPSMLLLGIGAGLMYVLDPSSLGVLKKVLVGASSNGLAFDSSGAHLYVSSQTGVVEVVQTSNDSVIATIKGISASIASQIASAAPAGGT